MRGPWNMSFEGQQFIAARTFHAPSGAVRGEDRLDGAEIGRGMIVRFVWLNHPAASLEIARVNDIAINNTWQELVEFPPEADRSVVLSAARGNVDISAALKRFNTIQLGWRYDDRFKSLAVGRYTPHAAHPLHFDSWLEIYESST